MFFENIVLMTLWYLWCDSGKWYRDVAMFGYFVSFFTGLVFMVKLNLTKALSTSDVTLSGCGWEGEKM